MMEDRDALLKRTLAGRVLAIVRLPDAEGLDETAAALIEGGITTLEFTLTTPGAVEAIARCREHFGDRAVVGAGTVLGAEDAQRCLAAGAQFLVSPGFDPEVVAAARDGGVLAMPGAMTPTEIVSAWRGGADVVKVFPARALGPRYISDVLAPLPGIPLMPTGGVDETNAAAYLKAGAVAIAAGGNLVSVAAVARRDWAAVTARARALVEATLSSVATV